MSKKLPVRDHIFHSLTRSVCHVCRRVVDAQALIRKGGIVLRKRCPEHGWQEALVSSDADWNLSALKYNKPGAIPLNFATAIDKGCPHDCGLCPEHQQHTCIGVIEITSRCNLGCSICFADAGSGYDLSLDQVEAMLDAFVQAEAEPEVVQISGGEPTIHPQILDVLAATRERGIRTVMLNTNGLRLAEDPEFARELAQYQPVIYLQFDGLSASTHMALRGRDLRAIKRRALDQVAEAGMVALLVDTIVKGVNDQEIGDTLRFGLEHPAVLGVNFQPATFTGRCVHADPLDRTTVSDVLHALEAQTEGMLRVSDFIPVPCPHPDCSACTYLFIDGERITPLTRLLNVDDYLDFIANRAAPSLSAEVQLALEGLWSMAAAMGTDQTTTDLACAACGIDVLPSSDGDFLKHHFFMVQVHGFMDEYNFDLKRLMKCCIHELLPDGRTVPFCAYNILGHREQVKRRQTELP